MPKRRSAAQVRSQRKASAVSAAKRRVSGKPVGKAGRAKQASAAKTAAAQKVFGNKPIAARLASGKPQTAEEKRRQQHFGHPDPSLPSSRIGGDSHHSYRVSQRHESNKKKLARISGYPKGHKAAVANKSHTEIDVMLLKARLKNKIRF